MRRPLGAAWIVAIGLAAGSDATAAAQTADAADAPPPTGRFTLFPLAAATVPPAAVSSNLWEAEIAGERLFHRPGDPDSLFSLGGAGPSGEARVAAAFEVNEVLLRAIAPDPRVAASDPRGRMTGDFRALDSAGRPYQFRLGARLVW